MAKAKKERKASRAKKAHTTKRVVRSKRSARQKPVVRKVASVRAAPAKMMAKSDLKIFKAILLIERAKVGGDLSTLTKDALNKSARDSSGDLSGYSYHMADVATDNYDREFNLSRASDEQDLLYRIDEALKRIEDGTYGACLQCSKSIPKKRLKVMPYGDLCINCQTMSDSK